MNAILYARVSTDRQAEKELSIPAQLQAMHDYARQRNWIVVGEFIEPGASARTADRPELKRLIACCRGDAKPDVVLVHKIDRLARNVYDHAMIRALLKQRGIRLASVVENVDESVSGELVENIMASIAQFYSGNLSDEVKKGMRQKVLKGGWPHLPPRGYVLVRSDNAPAARVEAHPSLGPLVRTAFERYATGWFSLKHLAVSLAKDGMTAASGLALAPSQVQRMLSNPFYAGQVHWQDLRVAGSHEALVSMTLFTRVQEMLRKRFRDPGTKGRVRGFPLRGLAICASCRGHMTGGYHKRRFGYYNCARRSYNKTLCAGRSYCPSIKAAADVQRLCEQLTLTPHLSEAVRAAADKLVKLRNRDSDRRLRSLRVKRSKLTDREMRLTDAFVAEDISPEAYKAASIKIRQDLERTDRELATLQRKPSDVMSRIDELLGRAASVRQLHEELTEPEQIELLRTVFQAVVLDETGMVGFTLRPPFGTILRGGAESATPLSVAGNPEQIGRELVDHIMAEIPSKPLTRTDVQGSQIVAAASDRPGRVSVPSSSP